MTNTTETQPHPIYDDPRFNESGTGAYREIKNLLREVLGDEEAARIGLASHARVNMGGDRPSNALRATIREMVPA